MSGPEDFEVDGVACRTQSNFNVKVGAGTKGAAWPKSLQSMVKLRVGEDHEAAARRWLTSDRGRRQAALADGEPMEDAVGGGLFEPVEVLMAEVNDLIWLTSTI